ncbi:MAG: hypothetical protein V4808_03485 [Pseudomonadota bacterium]
MIARTLTGIALLTAAMPAAAENWRPMGFMGEGAKVQLIYIDQDSLRKPTPDTREFVIATVFPTPQKLSDGKVFNWHQISYSLDCRTMMARSIQTSIHVPKAVVATGPTPGAPASLLISVPHALAAGAACSGNFSAHYQSQPASLYEGSLMRFGHRDAILTSRTSTSWYRVGVGGTAPNRIAMLIDRASLSAPNIVGDRLMTVMMVQETPAGTTKYFTRRGNMICRRLQHLFIYNELYSANGKYEGASFPATNAVDLVPGSGMFAIVAPICSNDWSRARAFPGQTPVSLAPNAFMP